MITKVRKTEELFNWRDCSFRHSGRGRKHTLRSRFNEHFRTGVDCRTGRDYIINKDYRFLLHMLSVLRLYLKSVANVRLSFFEAELDL